MALLQINYFSNVLKRVTTFHMFLPNDVQSYSTDGNKNYERNCKTLYLLHGFSGNTIDWMINSNASDMAQKYNLAIVMPSGENSFYLDGKGSGKAYGKFVGEELVDYVSKTFGLSKQKEDLFIGGLSMGGFGALHKGIKYHNTFHKSFGLSSALIVNGIKGMKPGESNEVADYDYYTSVFGDLNHLEESENNPEYLVKQLKRKGEEIPSLYMACGTEDFLLNENREFRDFLIHEKADITYVESKGIHNWDFWNEYLEPAIVWCLSK